MFSGRPPGGHIVNINIVIISVNITHILICGTVYDNAFDYISLSSLMLIMHGLTPISYTLYFRLYQYFVLPIKCLGISTRSEFTCSEHNMVSEAARKNKKREEEFVSTNIELYLELLVRFTKVLPVKRSQV